MAVRCQVAALLLGAAAGGVNGFIARAPGRSIYHGSSPKVPAAASTARTVMMKAKPAPFATPEEMAAEEGLKVSPSAWKWPSQWPYAADYFSRKTERSVEVNERAYLDPVYDEKAAEALARHYGRYIPENGAVLEIGASAHSYMPTEVRLTKHAGVGINQEELNANPKLTDRFVKDLNEDQSMPYEDEEFDAIVIANSIEFFNKPRELIREAWRVLKPGGVFIVSFATKSNYYEDRQIKIWGQMNDDQRMWIIGSLLWFACFDGFNELKAFDHSAEGSKGVLAGFSRKTPCHVVQAYKSGQPDETEEPYKRMMAKLWNANFMDMEDKSLSLARLMADYNNAETDEEKEAIMTGVKNLPALYEVLQRMGLALPVQLKAMMAANLAPRVEANEDSLAQLKMGLGLDPPSDSFWKPLGQITMKMNAEDKVLLLAECVPLFSSPDEDRRAAMFELLEVIPKATEIVKDIGGFDDGDAQLLAVDMVLSDYLYESQELRAAFLDWVRGLNKEDLEGYLDMRKNYKSQARLAEI